MITEFGKTQIRRYFAGQTGTIGGALAVGILNTAATVNDTRLAYEIARVPVTSIGSDLANNRIIFKGILPAELEGTIYEVGLFSDTATASKEIISTTGYEVWNAGSLNTANSRTGSALLLTPAANALMAAQKIDQAFDLSPFKSSDLFNFAYFVGNANATTIQVRLETDAANFFYYTLNNPTTGYKVSTWPKSGMTATGTPDWSNITVVSIHVVAGAGGAAEVAVDGLRIEDTSTLNPLTGLVARGVTAATPKAAGVPTDFEYALEITV